LAIKKSLDSGDRRSFICRIRDKTTETPRYLPSYTFIQFVGYINSELASNLKYKYSPDQAEESSDFNESLTLLNNHSTTLFENEPNNPETWKINNSMIEYYLIAHGSSFKQAPCYSPGCFVCKYDIDGKFIYAENW